MITAEPNDVYHANGCIGSSKVKAAAKGYDCFYDYMTSKKKPTDAMRRGSYLDAYFTEPHELENFKPCQLVTTTEEIAKKLDQRMPQSVRKIIDECEKQVVIRIGDRQAKFDLFDLKRRVIYDLKTTTQFDRIQYVLQDMLYDIQAGHYKGIADEELGEPFDFKFIFLDMASPHRWKIVDLPGDYLWQCTQRAEKALCQTRAFIHEFEDGRLPAFSHNYIVQELITPQFLPLTLEGRHENHFLPDTPDDFI